MKNQCDKCICTSCIKQYGCDSCDECKNIGGYVCFCVDQCRCEQIEMFEKAETSASVPMSGFDDK